jgi:hypothetical protein
MFHGMEPGQMSAQDSFYFQSDFVTGIASLNESF